MTFNKSLLTTGLMLAVAGAALADPTIKVMRSGAKSGQVGNVVVQGIPAGSSLTGATIVINIDATKTTVADQAANFTPGPGWTLQSQNTAGGKLIINLSNPDGQTANGAIVTIKATNSGATTFGGATLTVDPDTNIADADFNTFYPFSGGAVTVPFVNGSVRNLGGSANNAVSVGIDHVAAIAGNRLYLLNKSDLTDAGGAPAGGVDLGAPSTGGRPAFGTINGAAVVAAGADNGTMVVIPVAGGAAIATGNVGGQVVGAPAINNNVVYASVQRAAGPAIVMVGSAGGAGTPTSIGGAGETVVSSPLINAGSLLVGTTAGLKRFAVDSNNGQLTAQTDAITSDNINTSPVTKGAIATVGSASGKVYNVNVSTGAISGTAIQLPAEAAPMSDPFASADGQVHFGGHDGKLYSIAGGAATPRNFSTGALNSPVGASSATIYVGDNLGNVGTPGGAQINLGASLGTATTLTAPTGGSVVVNTGDGDVVAIAGA